MLKNQNFKSKVVNIQVLNSKYLVSPEKVRTFARHYNFRCLTNAAIV